MPNRGRHAKWVSQFVGDGQWVKRIDGQYILYEMEDGKEVVLGIVTPEGILESEYIIEKKTNTIYEYGASRALLLLCPLRWKESVEERWEQVFLYIVSEISPTSYLIRDKCPECPPGIHLARKKLDLFLQQGCGFSIKEIYAKLSGIRLLVDNESGAERISTPSAEQIAFAQQLRLEML